MKGCFFACILMVGVAVGGCRPCVEADPTGCSIEIDNVYADPAYDHGEIVNVLVLPFDNPMHITDFKLHHDELVHALLRNFGKYHYFNLQFDPFFDEFSGRLINLDTGKMERLKLGAVGQEYNADAVLKVSINDYRAFPPMRMRIKAMLVDANTGEKVWAFDHVFDTDDADVVNDIRRWWNSNIAGGDKRRNRFALATVRPSMFNNYVFERMAQSYASTRVDNVRKVQYQAAEEAAFEAEFNQMHGGVPDFDDEYPCE